MYQAIFIGVHYECGVIVSRVDFRTVGSSHFGSIVSIIGSRNNRKKYFFRARTICRPVFCFIHDVREKRFKNLKTYFQTNGAVPRTHGNKAIASSFDVVEHVKHFIENYGAVNGLY